MADFEALRRVCIRPYCELRGQSVEATRCAACGHRTRKLTSAQIAALMQSAPNPNLRALHQALDRAEGLRSLSSGLILVGSAVGLAGVIVALFIARQQAELGACLALISGLGLLILILAGLVASTVSELRITQLNDRVRGQTPRP